MGCEMMHDVLTREGLVINHKRTERIYREQKFSLKTHKPKRRISQLRLDLPKATRPNQRLLKLKFSNQIWTGNWVQVKRETTNIRSG